MWNRSWMKISHRWKVGISHHHLMNTKALTKNPLLSVSNKIMTLRELNILRSSHWKTSLFKSKMLLTMTRTTLSAINRSMTSPQKKKMKGKMEMRESSSKKTRSKTLTKKLLETKRKLSLSHNLLALYLINKEWSAICSTEVCKIWLGII